jgi:hypothetical protein
MNALTRISRILLILTLAVPAAFAAEAKNEKARMAELDAYWAEVSRCVKAGDFAGYQATCHESGVLVSGTSKSSYPLAHALVKWKPGFKDTESGKIRAKVEFRFSQRFGDKTTAHETGMFRYSTVAADGKATNAYIHFEALLIKRDSWKIMMEYQKSQGVSEEWDKLKPAVR